MRIFLTVVFIISFSFLLSEEEEKKDEYIVVADLTEGFMEGDESVLVATGNVKITHSSTVITSDKARSYEKKKMAILEDNVVIDDKEGGYHLTAGYVEYYREEKHSIATKEPVLVLTKREDKPLRIESVFMEMFQKDDLGIANGNVWIYQEDITAQCDKCTYFGEEEKITLEGDPIAWQNDSRLAGDLITLYMEEDVVKEIHVDENARMIYYSYEEEDEVIEEEDNENEIIDGNDEETDVTDNETKTEEDESFKNVESREEVESDGDRTEDESIILLEEREENRVNGEKDEDSNVEKGEIDEEKKIVGRVETAGDKMIAYFEDEVVRRVYIEGNAEGVYYPYEESVETGETVFSSGDIMDIFIENDNIDNIRLKGDVVSIYDPGGGEGGLTKTYGDIMVIYMDNEGEVDRVIVRGSARGLYINKEKESEEED